MSVIDNHCHNLNNCRQNEEIFFYLNWDGESIGIAIKIIFKAGNEITS